MSYQLSALPEYKQLQQVQSFYEPALRILNELIERNKANLRKRGYNEENAAITRTEFREQMARHLRITFHFATQIDNSLVAAERVQVLGLYVKVKKEIGESK